jgi:hypothetical protein
VVDELIELRAVGDLKRHENTWKKERPACALPHQDSSRTGPSSTSSWVIFSPQRPMTHSGPLPDASPGGGIHRARLRHAPR